MTAIRPEGFSRLGLSALPAPLHGADILLPHHSERAMLQGRRASSAGAGAALGPPLPRQDEPLIP